MAVTKKKTAKKKTLGKKPVKRQAKTNPMKAGETSRGLQWESLSSLILKVPFVERHPNPPSNDDMIRCLYIRVGEDFEISQWWRVMTVILTHTRGVDISKRWLRIDPNDASKGIAYIWRISERHDFEITSPALAAVMDAASRAVVNLTEVPMAQDQRIDRNVAQDEFERGVTNRTPR